MVEPREHGSKVESRAWRPEVELVDPHTNVELENGKPKADPNSWMRPPKK